MSYDLIMCRINTWAIFKHKARNSNLLWSMKHIEIQSDPRRITLTLAQLATSIAATAVCDGGEIWSNEEKQQLDMSSF
jgi:hypothetical protein